MGRTITSILACLCLVGWLATASTAWADDDEPDAGNLVVYVACPAEIGWTEVSPPSSQIVPPDRVPGLSLSLRGVDGWPEPVGEPGNTQQNLSEEGGTQASVALRVFATENPKTLRDALDHDHRAALANVDRRGTTSTRTVVSNEDDDFQGRPSWFVRARAELPYGEVLCSATEYSVREVLVEHGGTAYLVQVWGSYSWRLTQSEREESDPGVADVVADQVENGLTVEADR